jgi:O-acetyl-ADP-ribose deacetylase (regulator of RNase III)
MGSGIAAQIAKEFPEAYEADKKFTKYGDINKLGSYELAATDFGFIINMYTQFHPGRVPRKQDLYDAIRKGFIAIDSPCAKDKIWSVGIPLIGAGIAGGNWEKIKKIINEVTPNSQITVVEYEPKKV